MPFATGGARRLVSKKPLQIESGYAVRRLGRKVFTAASAPKKVQWYDGGHELNDRARAEREDWLSERLGVD